jgi:drug/metabolite transporter (DMT)-like permease
MNKKLQPKFFPPAYIALTAALLFGASTPAAKLLIGHVSPLLLAGLLYLGSGLGLLLLSAVSKAIRGPGQETKLKKADVPWLAGAVLFGGILGPLLLMVGLKSTSGGAASLLLNMEAVFTAVLAWFAFKENFDRRIFLGMVAIVAGSLLLSWQPGAAFVISMGSLAIIAACFCWALDNNLTRHISDSDPVQIAAIKGLFAGLVNTTIALAVGQTLPSLPVFAAATIVGFFGYGVSLVLFIKALRHMGTARTGAYFSTAPFVGAILSLILLQEPLSVNLAAAGLLMGLGVWLHLTETHDHEHSHPEEEHEHLHYHDEHHQHEHASDTKSGEPHSHRHKHVPITHSHPHYPDIEHRHEH